MLTIENKINVLKVDGICKSYNRFNLNNVSFDVNSGEVVGFIGINGAGKTTTMKIISGLTLPNKGNVYFWGEKINNENKEKIFNKIGFIFDENYFYQNLTLKQMRDVVAASYSNWDEKQFETYINKFKLPINKKICELSKGMKIKFSLAIAFSHHADLLILDEPTSGLDPVIRKGILDVLNNLAKQGKSVLFSTHITSDLENIATRLIMINEGKICLNEPVEKIKSTYCKVRGNLSTLDSRNEDTFFYMKRYQNYFEALSSKRNVCKDVPSWEIFDISFDDLILQFVKEEEF